MAVCKQDPSEAERGASAPDDTSEIFGGSTTNPAGDELPDLTRLSLGDGGDPLSPRAGDDSSRGGSVVSSGRPSSSVHVAVHAHGTPVTINIIHGAAPGPAPRAVDESPRQPRREHARRIRVPPQPHAQGLPVASPSRVRLGAPLPHMQAPTPRTPAASPVPVAQQAPLSPLFPGLGMPITPASPQLESVPASPATSSSSLVSACVPIEGYEYIAPRDPSHNRWYVATAGRRVGIWREWLDMSHYVLRVPGSRHKSFSTRAEAEAHYFGNKAGGHVEYILP